MRITKGRFFRAAGERMHGTPTRLDGPEFCARSRTGTRRSDVLPLLAQGLRKPVLPKHCKGIRILCHRLLPHAKIPRGAPSLTS
jgi:hypothetical protein